MEGIRIAKVKSKTPDDIRGNVYHVIENRPGLQVTVYTRKSGVSFANHFHKGGDPAKNPEIFFLINGRVEMAAKNQRGEEFKTVLEPGHLLEIDPGIYHSMLALDDVVFFEYRATVFDESNKDSYSLDEFEVYVRSR